MEPRSLGRSGVKVSPLCLGTMQFGWTADEKTSFEVLDAAYDLFTVDRWESGRGR